MGIEVAIFQVVTALGVQWGTAAVITAGIIAVGQAAILYAATSYVAKRSLPGSPDLASRTLTSRGTIDPQKIIYGEALVGGTLAYRNALGLKNREMWAVHVIAGHECESITDVYFDEKLVTNAEINSGAAAGGVISSGTYAPVRGQTVAAVYKHLGTSTQTANAQLVAATGDWTSAHRLRGHTYGVTEFVLWDKTQTIWEASDPTNVSFLVKGKKVYDPRLDSTQIIDSDTSPVTYGSGAHRVADPTTWEWSDCPPLCLADFLMDSKFSPLANGVDQSRINWESVAKAADDCDTLVFIPPAASPQNTEKRFTCNGVIYGSENVEQNVASLLSCFNGNLAFSGGQYYIYAGVYRAPSDDLDEGDVIGPISINSALDSDKRVNTIKAVYTDPNKDYKVTETADIELYKDSRDNGDPLFESIDLPMVNSWYMAQRLALLRLQEYNQEMTISVPCNLKAASFVPGQRINFTFNEFSWTPKIFQVISWEFFDRGGSQIGVNLRLKEDDSTAYADPDIADYNTVDSSGTLTLADPTPVPGIDSLPRGVRIGEGGWNINLVKDSDNGTPDNNDGEIWLSAGTFLLPDGTIRVLASGVSCYTPYESSTVPPDAVGYVMWGASDPRTRFASSPEYVFGTTASMVAGIFPVIYDRFADQFYAVANSGDEIAFTPADTDFIVARFLKTSASGGLDALTSYVAFVNDPQATVGATLGVDVFNEAGGVLSDIDVRNDQLVVNALSAENQNPTFEIPRVGPTGNPAPASWYGYGSAAAAQYKDASRDVIIIPADAGLQYSGAVFIPEPGAEYEISALVRKTDAGDATRFVMAVREYDSDLPSGVRAISTTSGQAGADPASIFVTQTRAVALTSPNTAYATSNQWDLTTTYAVFLGTYVPTSTCRYASIVLDAANNVGATGDLEIEWCILRSKSTRNTGALADQDVVDFATQVTGSEKPANNATNNTGALADEDSVSQFQIDLYAAHRVAAETTAAGISLAGTGYVTIEDVAITLPATITDSVVQIDATFSILGIGAGGEAGLTQYYQAMAVRLLDQDNAVVQTDVLYLPYFRNTNGSSSVRIAADAYAYTFYVPSANLNAGASNTFKLQIDRDVTSNWSSLTAFQRNIRATLLNQAE